MRKAEESNRFVKELQEVNQNSSPASLEMLRDFNLKMKQIESIPSLPQTTLGVSEEPSRQPISLKLVRQWLSRKG